MLNQMKIHLFAIICYITVGISSSAEIPVETDTLNLSQSITLHESLISAQKQFQLGFFSPGNSRKFYLGIWYNNIPTQTIVWIANRDIPLNDTSGVLSIGNDGNLILLDKTETIIWSTNIQNISSRTTVAQLLDSGNLVLRDSKEEATFLWQSFDHPSHAMISGMKLGWNLRTGLNLYLTSWKSSDNPSPGDYTYGVDLQGLPQLVIWKGPVKLYRSGPWNGQYFSGLPLLNLSNTNFIINSEEVYYEQSLHDGTSLVMGAISYIGEVELLLRDNSTNDWRGMFTVPQDNCDNYGFCGPNSVCDINNDQVCSCMTGYIPKSSREWDARIWSGGCIRENPLNCSETVNFIELVGFKMPDFLQFSMNTSISLEKCRDECSKNCSCTAYTYADTPGVGNGCLFWFGDLIDVRKLTILPNRRLYLRFTASDLGSKIKKQVVVIGVIIAASVLLLSVILFIIWKRKSHQEGRRQGSQVADKENLELPYFDFATIARATENFSDTNKIGEGGFGLVYKGKLSTGQEIAVKRLSEKSSQGPDEFKNEVMLIAKLQHRHLIRLLGCCIHGEERMLIYEYISNGSLDSYIFGGSNHAKSHLLAWRQRFGVIVGIARGLLYLHRDSRLKIIHRDLKASNVLLDNEMNPKISDFGLARTFEEQLATRTRRVVGTFGYMSPEYVIDGLYSMKSDVFSYGVLVLEIVSGKRNSRFQHPDHEFNLLGHAWKLWCEGKASDLIDSLMEESFPVSEVLRCIQVGLLCVQQRPEDRPTMSSILLMLDNENAMLPQPKPPGYFTERFINETDSHLGGRLWTINEMTNTMTQGR